MTAALVRIIARMHFEGRDGELAQLIGTHLNCSSDASRADRNPALQKIAKIKGNIDTGNGIGGPLILSIMRSRRRLAGETSPEADNDTRGLVAIREAVATLNAWGVATSATAEE